MYQSLRYGNLVSIVNPDFVWTITQPRRRIFVEYDYYIVLEGELKGKRFLKHKRPLGDPSLKLGNEQRLNSTEEVKEIERNHGNEQKEKNEESWVDKVIFFLKNHKISGTIIVFGISVIAAADFLGAFEVIWKYLHPNPYYAEPAPGLLALRVESISALDMANKEMGKNLTISLKVIPQSREQHVPLKAKGDLKIIGLGVDTLVFTFDANIDKEEIPPTVVSPLTFDGLIPYPVYDSLYKLGAKAICTIYYDSDIIPTRQTYETALFELSNKNINDAGRMSAKLPEDETERQNKIRLIKKIDEEIEKRLSDFLKNLIEHKEFIKTPLDEKFSYIPIGEGTLFRSDHLADNVNYYCRAILLRNNPDYLYPEFKERSAIALMRELLDLEKDEAEKKRIQMAIKYLSIRLNPESNFLKFWQKLKANVLLGRWTKTGPYTDCQIKPIC